MAAVTLIRRRGFEPLLAVCQRLFAETLVEVDQPSAGALVECSSPIIVVCCDHPDAFRNYLAVLNEASPLSEIIVVGSEWTRATGRTRRQWPPSWQYTESQAIARLTAIADGAEMAVPRPTTWTRDERWLATGI